MILIEGWSDTPCHTTPRNSTDDQIHSLIAGPSEIDSSTYDIEFFPGTPADITTEQDIGTRLETKPEHIPDSECPYLGSIGSWITSIERIICWSSSISVDPYYLAGEAIETLCPQRPRIRIVKTRTISERCIEISIIAELESSYRVTRIIRWYTISGDGVVLTRWSNESPSYGSEEYDLR